MKFAKLFFVFLLALMLFSFVAAVDIEVKDSVKKGENFIVKISGTFTKPIIASQVEFNRGSSSVNFGKINLINIEGDYYFYLQIPRTEERTLGDYTMTIKDVSYRSAGKIVTSDLTAPFTIINETVPFSISPPLIVTSGQYSVDVENLMPKKIVIDLEKITMPVGNVSQGLLDNLSISDIENETEKQGFFATLFAAFSSDKNATQEENITEGETGVPITGAVVVTNSITLKDGETITLEFNAPAEKGFEKLDLYYENIPYGVLVYNPEVKTIVIQDDEKNDSVNTTEPSENFTNDAAEGTIAVDNVTYVIDRNKTSENNTEIIVTENGTFINISSNQVIGSDTQTCKEQNGNVCTPNKEICIGDVVQARANLCCLGTCETIKKTSTGKLIGWIIIIVIVLFLVWFIKQKYMKASPGRVDLLNK
ncbi:MAG: hypothetical protein PF542_00140 [Nanoarchaeota archaeon]|jgi:hypothetical protein|nr:hypothetical protein [Nanoarchaeota archaeon]